MKQNESSTGTDKVLILSKFFSHAIGVFTTLLFWALLICIQINLSPSWMQDDIWQISLGIILLIPSSYLVFYNGLITISVAHRGILKIMGTRQKNWQLDEGYYWLLPRPFMDAEEVNMETDSMVIEFTIISKNLISMTVKATFQHRVRNAFKWISIKPGVVKEGLAALSEESTREIAGTQTDLQLMGIHNDQEPTDTVSLRAKIEAGLEDLPGEGLTLDEWGVDIASIIINSILPTDPKVREAYESQRKEELETARDNQNTDTLIKNVQRLAKELNISELEAAEMYRLERNPNSKEFIVRSGTGKTPGDFTTGAVLNQKD